jgi:hypothetical protein
MVPSRSVSRVNEEGMTMKTKSTMMMSATLVFLAAAAHAADGKSYPASMCHPANPQQVYVDLGAMYNGSSQQAYVDCPIIQDGNGGLNVGKVAAKDMRTDSSDPAVSHLDQVYCVLFATKYFDAPGRPAFLFASAKATEGASERFQTLRMDGGPTPPLSSMEISCRIPPASPSGDSGIGQYFSEEP